MLVEDAEDLYALSFLRGLRNTKSYEVFEIECVLRKSLEIRCVKIVDFGLYTQISESLSYIPFVLLFMHTTFFIKQQLRIDIEKNN